MEWAAAHRTRFDAFLADRYADAWPATFTDPLRYPVFGGGKRFRPLAALAAFEACAGDPTDFARVLPCSAAVELVHTYSLVHDDLPAMDDDDERRGRPTVHVAWDESTAILVGDALLTDAFAMLASAPLSAQARIASSPPRRRAALAYTVPMDTVAGNTSMRSREDSKLGDEASRTSFTAFIVERSTQSRGTVDWLRWSRSSFLSVSPGP